MASFALRPRFRTFVYATCLFCIVLGLKWATFDRFGSAMPDWDQWDAEACYSLTPWYENQPYLGPLFTPHNEHRVVVTKLQNLAVTILTGQWDVRVQCVANAFIHTTLATALWLIARRRLAPVSHAPLWFLAVALFGLPLAWQNILFGFHSQQYWLLLTSLVALALLPFARPWSFRWWIGAGAATLALFTMGSGLFAAAVVLLVLLFRLVCRDTPLRAAWPALALSLVLVAIGFLTRHEYPPHEHMKAKTVHDFVFSLVHSLQWPTSGPHEWAAAILWLPWLVMAFRVLRPAASNPAASPHRDSGQLILSLGGWILVQLLATAYARGANADYPAPRYMDTLSFGIMANGLCLAWLRTSTPAFASRLFTGFAYVWLGVFGFGAFGLLKFNLEKDLPESRSYHFAAESHLRGYLATDDPAQLAFDDIPYPSASTLMERLAPRSLRALMPAAVRPPLPVTVASAGPFVEGRASQLALLTTPRLGLSPATLPLASTPTWGTYTTEAGPATTGEWRSAPLTAPLQGWLKFEIAGQLGESSGSLALELRDARTDAMLAAIAPTKVPGDAWRAAYVRAPREPFVIVARDHDATRWFAFSAPVEMARLSYLTWRVSRHGLLLAQFAGGAALALLGFAWLAERRLRASPPTAS